MKTKTFKVRMMAFGKPDEVREVDVPVEDLTGNTDADLEQVWKWGQNDYQPKQHPSVSMGDVVEYDNKLFIAVTFGFAEMTPEQFKKYEAMPRRDRAFAFFVENGKLTVE